MSKARDLATLAGSYSNSTGGASGSGFCRITYWS